MGRKARPGGRAFFAAAANVFAAAANAGVLAAGDIRHSQRALTWIEE